MDLNLQYTIHELGKPRDTKKYNLGRKHQHQFMKTESQRLAKRAKTTNPRAITKNDTHL